MSGLRDKIRAAGFRTQRQFAKHIGFAEESVSRISHGKLPMPRLLSLYLEAIQLSQQGLATLPETSPDAGREPVPGKPAEALPQPLRASAGANSHGDVP